MDSKPQCLTIISPGAYNLTFKQSADACSAAVMRTLKSAGVQFVRYIAVDSSNNIRCKAVPLKRLQQSKTFDNQVSIAEACFGALPSFGDILVPDSSVNAAHVLTIKPDMGTLRILPYATKTAMVIGSMYESSTQKVSALCPRGLLARVLETAEVHHGIGFQVGAELEFALVRDEGDLGMGQLPKPVDASVFANTTTLTDQEEFISDLYEQLEEQDIDIEQIHAESAPGQLEVVLGYLTNVMALADHVVFARETIRSVARKHRMRALFLPKVYKMQAGNGLHLHFSFRSLHSANPNDNAFSSIDRSGVPSQQGAAFIEGILQHLPSLLAFTLPSVNSFLRVGKGCWTGSSVSWNTEDKESPLRVCLDLESGEATNVEMKLCDSMANIHLALAAILASGLDGIVQNLSLRPSADEDDNPHSLPPSFAHCLDLLESDSFFLSILGKEMMANYITVRRAEIQHIKTSNLSYEDDVIMSYNKS